LDRAARNTHSFSGNGLVKSFDVAKAESLELILAEIENLEFGQGNGARFEDSIAFKFSAGPVFSRSRHVLDSFCAYAHYK
jgi:hypothetical protein